MNMYSIDVHVGVLVHVAVLVAVHVHVYVRILLCYMIPLAAGDALSRWVLMTCYL